MAAGSTRGRVGGMRLGVPGDRFEQEADRVARGVGTGDRTPARVPARAPAGGGPGPGHGDPVDPRVERAVRRSQRGGRALAPEVRGRVEQTLGADLGGVRVHTDSQADRLNRALQARSGRQF